MSSLKSVVSIMFLMRFSSIELQIKVITSCSDLYVLGIIGSSFGYQVVLQLEHVHLPPTTLCCSYSLLLQFGLVAILNILIIVMTRQTYLGAFR